MHVFRYYDNKLCPTMEEFQTYLHGFVNSHILAIPPVQENMSHLQRMTLNVSEEIATSIIDDGELDIVRLIELYGPGGILKNNVEPSHEHFAFSICALATYMLASQGSNTRRHKTSCTTPHKVLVATLPFSNDEEVNQH